MFNGGFSNDLEDRKRFFLEYFFVKLGMSGLVGLGVNDALVCPLMIYTAVHSLRVNS